MSPVDMQRVALLAPRDAVRDVLVEVADEGTVGLDDVPPGSDSRVRGPATALLLRLHTGDTVPARLSATPPDLARCEEEGRLDLIAGEAQVEQRVGQSLSRGGVVGLVGWIPAEDVAHLRERVAPLGGAVVPIPRPAGVQPPTLLPTSGASRELAPLVETYATVPYADLNPSLVAGLAYVVMFGMMFADVGHGALLLLAGVAVRLQWRPRLAR
ncbi:MAG TPA: V-type ATPase 116kDa subunit family protein, partial [Ornithinibacter sp.]|nr:V-type ATPase 116kDa subunit family protein [Ornithinibacter sp.]